MAELIVVVLGLIGLIAIGGAAAVMYRKPPPPEPSALEAARDKWIASGDPADERRWRRMLEDTGE